MPERKKRKRKNLPDNSVSNEELKLGTLLKNLESGVIVQDRNGQIISANPAARKLLGLTLAQLKGRESGDPRWHAIHTDGSEFKGKDHPAMISLKTGKRIKNILMGVFNPKLKKYRWLKIDSYPQFKKGKKKPYEVIVIFQDITKSKQSEDMLQKSEEKYRALFNTMREGASLHEIVYDKKGIAKDYKVLDVNKTFEKTLGIKKKDAVGKLSKNLYKTKYPPYFDIYLRVVNSGKSESFETYFPPMDKYFNISVFSHLPNQFATVFQDITESKKSKYLLEKTNRLYAVISQINQMIVRAENEDEVFQKTCTITISYGEFPFVWIGINDRPGKKLKPVAWRSEKIGDSVRMNNLPSEKILLSDKLAEESVKKDEIYVIDDLQEKFKDKSAKSGLLKYGYKSAISVPIRLFNKKIIGAFTLYSTLKNYFGEKEITLFEEIISDISFALTTFEIDKAGRQAEEKLKITQFTIDNASIPITWINKDGIIVYANDGARKIVQKHNENIVGQHIEKYNQSFSKRLWKKHWNELKSKGSLSSTAKVLDKFGYVHYLDVYEYYSSVYHKEYSVNISMDVTENKLAEKALRESEDRFRKAFLTSPDSININRLEDGLYVEVNNGFLATTGYNREEVIGKTSEEINIWQRLSDREKLVKELNREGRVRNLEAKFVMKDGRILNGLMSAAIVELNDEPHILSITRDISDIKETEHKLKESEEKFRKLTETTHGAIFIYQLDKFVYVNKASEELTGYSKEELYKMKFWDVVHPDFQELIKERGFARQAGLTLPSSYEFKIITKNGEEKWLDFTAGYIEYNGQQAALGTAFDITERELAREKAERSDQVKTEFLAQMSHEIRSPIHVIIGFTNLLREELRNKLDDEIYASFESINLSGKRIIRTIDSILNMSELQTGTYEIIQKKVDLIERVLQPLYQEYRQFAAEKNLRLELELDIDKAEVEVDEYSVTQTFSNLLDNALKYTNDGFVKIKVGYNSNSKVFIEIKDSGIGISENYLPKIFDSFTQEEQGYSRSFEGNGLGLALVKKYCELNNAEIEVESEKGTGTTFRVTY